MTTHANNKNQYTNGIPCRVAGGDTDAYKVIAQTFSPPSESSIENEYAYIEDVIAARTAQNIVPSTNGYQSETHVDIDPRRVNKPPQIPLPVPPPPTLPAQPATYNQAMSCTGCHDTRHYFEIDSGQQLPPSYFSASQTCTVSLNKLH